MDNQANELAAQQKNCPFCGEMILAIAKKCKHCGEFLERAQANVDGPEKVARFISDGHVVFTCSYDQAFSIVERALSECEVTGKERSLEKGILKGKCKYGINPFGMTITATFYSDGGPVHAEITAAFTDSFDTMGACKTKISQISERVQSLADAGQTDQVDSRSSVARLDSQSAAGQFMPPSYTERAGPSYKGKARTALIFSLLGLVFLPGAVVGLIMGCLAIRGMSTSSNKQGKHLAATAVIIGFVGLLGWIMYLAST